MRRLVPLLIVLALPGFADAAKPKDSVVDDGGWRHFLYPDPGFAQGVGVFYDRIETTLDLTQPDALELRTSAVIGRTEAGLLRVEVSEFDPSLGETCTLDSPDVEVVDDDPEESTAVPLELEVGTAGQNGLVPCIVVLPPGEDLTSVSVVVRRPRIDGLERQFAFRRPVQPRNLPAKTLVFSVESFAESEPSVQLLRWNTALRKQALEGGRLRTFYAVEQVLPRIPDGGIRSFSGRVPEVVVTSGENWDDVALDHRLQYLAAARATGPVLRMAGRVLGRGGGLPSVREAARIALDEIELDEMGGGGGTWRLPQSAQYTLEDKRGTASDRAALLISLLRTADMRAEIVLTSVDGEEPHPDRVVPVLDRTLVYVPDVQQPDGRPLFIDPTHGSSWLGELDELLAGRSGALLAPEGVRWLRLPGDLLASSWSLRATESEDGSFALNIQGRLQGAASARVRAWDRAGRPAESKPVGDLVWAGGPWADALEVSVREGPSGSLVVQAAGRISAAAGTDQDGRLMPPPLPAIVHGFPQEWTIRVLGIDANLFALELRESWRFRGRRAGSGSPSLKRTTPFWDARTYGSWTGPLFNRETVVRWTGRHLSAAASKEPSRFTEQLGEVFGGVQRPEQDGR